MSDDYRTRKENVVPPDREFCPHLARAEKAEEALERFGFRRCDVAACNCGSFHPTVGVALLKAQLAEARNYIIAMHAGAVMKQESYQDFLDRTRPSHPSSPEAPKESKP